MLFANLLLIASFVVMLAYIFAIRKDD